MKNVRYLNFLYNLMKKIMRYTKKINTVFHNYIQFKNKMIRVDNPMQIMFKNFKNINKLTFLLK